tara:strand:+ start:167 stop:511 length:345 start_codon:yes stop_codon:yes gene_type:complete
MANNDDRIFVDFEPNDFVIRISPILDEEDNWTGELNVGYLTMDENFLKEDDYTHLDVVTNMAVSSIPLMEDDLTFRNHLYNYTSSLIKQQKGTKRPEIIKDGSNVIKLDFNATT